MIANHAGQDSIVKVNQFQYHALPEGIAKLEQVILH